MPSATRLERALFTFDHTHHALRAQYLLSKDGLHVKAVAPPPEIRSGCDVAVEIDVEEIRWAEEVLKSNNVEFADVIFVERQMRPLELSKLLKEFELDGYIMVRCGSLKLTFEKKSQIIVNVSGGACPDIPYIAQNLIGKPLGGKERPVTYGVSLCAYCLDKAYDRALELIREIE